MDEDARAEAYSQAQNILWEDLPAIPLLSSCYTSAYNEHIEGIDLTAAGCFFLMNAKYVE